MAVPNYITEYTTSNQDIKAVNPKDLLRAPGKHGKYGNNCHYLPKLRYVSNLKLVRDVGDVAYLNLYCSTALQYYSFVAYT